MGLSVNPSGFLRVLRYLWSQPAVRKLVGWLLQALFTMVLDWLKKKRKKDGTDKLE